MSSLRRLHAPACLALAASMTCSAGAQPSQPSGAPAPRVVAGRPLLYRQVRVGAGGEPFEMVKFRTMRVDAEEQGGAQLATAGDPRVIPACRWVRATRADELPP